MRSQSCLTKSSLTTIILRRLVWPQKCSPSDDFHSQARGCGGLQVAHDKFSQVSPHSRAVCHSFLSYDDSKITRCNDWLFSKENERRGDKVLARDFQSCMPQKPSLASRSASRFSHPEIAKVSMLESSCETAKPNVLSTPSLHGRRANILHDETPRVMH